MYSTDFWLFKIYVAVAGHFSSTGANAYYSLIYI